MLCPDGETFDKFIKCVVFLPKSKQFFTCGRSYGSIFGNVDLNFTMIGLNIDCR